METGTLLGYFRGIDYANNQISSCTGGIYKVFAWGLLFFDENQWMWKHNIVHLQENSSCHINLDNIIVKNKLFKKSIIEAADEVKGHI